MLGDKSSCKEASHAVTEKKIRLVRVVVFHHFCESIHILDSVFPAMFRGEVAKLGAVVHTVAMTEVVVSAYCEAQACEELSEVVITSEIFAHTVGYLNDTSYCADRETNVIRDLMKSVRGQIVAFEMSTIHRNLPPWG